MYRLFKIISILLFLISAANLNAGEDMSAIVKEAKARVDAVRNYEADMSIARSKKKPVIRKAHVHYAGEAFRVEMVEPSAGRVYLFKRDVKYELNNKDNRFAVSKYISPDFKAQEPLSGILFLLSYVDKLSDKKMTSHKNRYRVILNTVVNRIEVLISKKNHVIEKVLSFIDSEQVTEVSFEYREIGEYLFPVKKKTKIFINKESEETVVRLEGVKVNREIDKRLFLVGE